jgi:hypothetical protein
MRSQAIDPSRTNRSLNGIETNRAAFEREREHEQEQEQEHEHEHEQRSEQGAAGYEEATWLTMA